MASSRQAPKTTGPPGRVNALARWIPDSTERLETHRSLQFDQHTDQISMITLAIKIFPIFLFYQLAIEDPGI
ncbi:MAG: hypothetical protein V4646_02245 [Pseudomonadota bacterium]